MCYITFNNSSCTVSYPHGLEKENVYEPKRNLITDIYYKQAQQSLIQQSQSYDPLERPLQRKRTQQTQKEQQSFFYNPRNELIQVQKPQGNYLYAYDNIGNRKTTQNPNGGSTYTTNALNQYQEIISAGQAFAPEYDLDGNQTKILTKTGEWKVSYDAYKRPILFIQERAQLQIRFQYDIMGRQIRKTVTKRGVIIKHENYLYKAYLRIMGFNRLIGKGEPLYKIFWDPSEPIATKPLAIEIAGKLYYYAHDHSKNVTDLLDATGKIVAHYDYDPYGNVTATGELANLNPIQYSREVYDPELGLVIYNYRHYNPLDGRWISRDPIEKNGGLNLYGFVGNNPLLWFDYLGNQAPGFEGAVCARQLREIKEKYLEPVGPVTPIQAGVSMANGSASQNNLFKQVAKTGVGKKGSVKETITGKELLEYFQQLSENSCCIQKLTIAGHGWSSGTPKDIVARPDGPGLPGKDNGTGFYKDESGQASTNLAREMKDLKREIIRKRVRFCSPCEIIIHACNISSEFAESFAATTECKITYARGSCSTVGDNVRKWSSGCGAEQGSENDASNGFWQTDGGKASISKGRYFTQR